MGSDSLHHFPAWCRVMGNRNIVLTPERLGNDIPGGSSPTLGSCGGEETVRVDALWQAVSIGLRDLETGQFEEISALHIDEYLSNLGDSAIKA
jgi:hypothetical protein